MKNLDTIDAVREFLSPHRVTGKQIGFVPTLGALHAGHRSLIRRARDECDVVIVSIFVNPTQFAPGEDYAKYPKPLAADLTCCREDGVDAVFCPAASEMYPDDSSTTVAVTGLTEGLCGEHRAGHFDGVTTVVAILFHIVQPDVAYFGQKDAQQAAIIKRMVRDLAFPVEVVVCPTVREPDGLAMSSRNAYLDPERRAQATCLYKALTGARDQIEAGQHNVAVLIRAMRDIVASAGPCSIDYIDIVDPDTMQPKTAVEGKCLAALAVRIGNTRLIDNILIDAG